jgi:hypothetical protein
MVEQEETHDNSKGQFQHCLEYMSLQLLDYGHSHQDIVSQIFMHSKANI